MIYGLKFISFDKFDLGKEYLISFGYFDEKYVKRVKFIKTTAKGFNFLDVQTNKCILKRHLYINKSENICLLRCVCIAGFEIELEGGEERLINIDRIC